jgi:sterol desaturase/sphingolipid hydroxylase (fatty acid hydroxylase superfamily)
LAIAGTWLLARGTGLGASLRMIFDRRVWLRRSSLTDLKYTAFYLLVLRAAITTVEGAAFTGALAFSARALGALRPEGSVSWTFTASPLIEGALATAATMISIDFASYAVHRLMHAIPALWKIHRTHHSAEQLTPLTTYRQHPLEPLLLYGARGLAAGTALAALHVLFPSHTPVITISGLGAGFFVYMFTVNLHHAHIPVRYPRWLRAVLISPHIHHLHHSADPRHHDRCYGVVFSWWDRLFGTYLDEEFEPGEIRFGLETLPGAFREPAG